MTRLGAGLRLPLRPGRHVFEVSDGAGRMARAELGWEVRHPSAATHLGVPLVGRSSARMGPAHPQDLRGRPLVCPRCLSVKHVVAFITEPRVIRRILDHLAASARRATGRRAPPPIALPAPAFP